MRLRSHADRVCSGTAVRSGVDRFNNGCCVSTHARPNVVSISAAWSQTKQVRHADTVFAIYVRSLTLHPIQLESKQHRCRTCDSWASDRSFDLAKFLCIAPERRARLDCMCAASPDEFSCGRRSRRASWRAAAARLCRTESASNWGRAPAGKYRAELFGVTVPHSRTLQPEAGARTDDERRPA
jgi:hypothetical protein